MADSDVYLCVDDHGVKEYRNNSLTKNCKKIDLPGLTVMPAPVFKKEKMAPHGDFPQVDEKTQKKRDGDRKKILQDELANEQKKLNELNSTYQNGNPERLGDERNYEKYQERTAAMKADIDRSQKNIEALQREITNLN
jgi:hypothetical protein